jgi:EAL domain-containing protein (putative c-di-GMP-specific phosphodiesterase class I)
MCEELDTVVIAEGIENAQEASALRDLGVRYHQGYWYARPQLGVLPAINLECFAA